MNIPDFNEPGLTRLLVDMDKNITKVSRDMLPKSTAIPEIFLQAANGKVYKLTVSNTGVLTSTYVSG